MRTIWAERLQRGQRLGIASSRLMQGFIAVAPLPGNAWSVSPRPPARRGIPIACGHGRRVSMLCL